MYFVRREQTTKPSLSECLQNSMNGLTVIWNWTYVVLFMRLLFRRSLMHVLWGKVHTLLPIRYIGAVSRDANPRIFMWVGHNVSWEPDIAHKINKELILLLWRNGMDVPSKCTIVRTVGYVGVRLWEWSVGRNEDKTHKINERSAM